MPGNFAIAVPLAVGAPLSAPPLTGFPVFDSYTAIMLFRGQTPIPLNNNRWWELNPAYPTSAISTETSVAAAYAAANSAPPGSVVFLRDNAYNDPGEHTLTNNDVILAAETKGGVLIDGQYHGRCDGARNDFMGFVHTGQNQVPGQTEGVYTLNGNDNRIVNTRFFQLWGRFGNDPTDSGNLHEVRFHGVRNRACYIFIDNKMNDRACFRGDQDSIHTRIDHCKDIDHRGTGNSGDIEFVQTGQDDENANTCWLIDSCWLKGLNNNGFGIRVRGAEREGISLKSSCNIVMQNVLDECCIQINDRNSHRSTIMANWILANGVNGSGGLSIGGDESLGACNYVADVNPDDIGGVGGMRMQEGGGNNYHAAVDAELSFNTVKNCRNSVGYSSGGGSGSPFTTRPRTFNNLVDFHPAESESVTKEVWTGQAVGGGNVMRPLTGLSSSPPDVVAQQPDIELDSDLGLYYVPQTTGRANCNATGVSGFHELCTNDIIGNPIDPNNPNPGCLQPGWNFQPINWVQAIRNAAGVN